MVKAPESISYLIKSHLISIGELDWLNEFRLVFRQVLQFHHTALTLDNLHDSLSYSSFVETILAFLRKRPESLAKVSQGNDLTW